MPKIIIAPDSLKGSLSAPEVAEAIYHGFKRAQPKFEYKLIPIADGGEGTLDCLVGATKGEVVELDVLGPLGERILARYGILGDRKTAVIEMAEAAGLPLVPEEKRSPRHTTTFGVGELVAAALDRGLTEFIVGIGGSATNDGGSGMIAALGARFLGVDRQEIDVLEGGEVLRDIHSIDLSELDPRLSETRFQVACDVTNPLCGDNGAAAIFGPQKGATAEDILFLDQCLSSFAEVIKRDLGKDIATVPGAGAAGGLGAGFLAFTNAILRSGFDIVADQLELDRALDGASVVITAEGKIDFQTLNGKAPFGVLQRAKKKGVPEIIGMAGKIGE